MKRLIVNNSALDQGVRYLENQDKHLKLVVSKYGPPPLWERDQGFKTLIHIILEQQVSLASARAAFEKLSEHINVVSPANFLNISDRKLKEIGFSRQKMSYGRNLAIAINEGSLDLTMLSDLDDGDAKARLTKIKGIGPWTADIYLLMALGRPDVWPKGDLALALAVQKLKRMRTRPTTESLEKMSLKWQPWRSVAARILWHYYLSDQYAAP